MDVKIGKFSAGVLSPVVNIENFKLYNPPEYGGTPFLDIPELHIKYDRVALAYRVLHIKLLRLNVAELNVVRNDAGHTNLTNLRWKATSRGSGRRDAILFPVIDVLNLSVGKARFMDLKDPRHNREYLPNLQNQIFKNVESEDDAKGILFMIWLRSGGGITTTHAPDAVLKVDGERWLPRLRTNFTEEIATATGAIPSQSIHSQPS